jgi:hypothetical protein
MKKSVYVKPNCLVKAVAQLLMFPTSGEDPVTPGIGTAKENFDDQGDDYQLQGSNIWDD